MWCATTEDLRPFAVTMNKLYATFDDTQAWFDVLTGWLDARAFWRYEVQHFAGQRVLRVLRPAPKPQSAAQEPIEEGPARKAWWHRG